MTNLKAAALGLAFLAFAGGATLAQADPMMSNGGTMGNGHMSNSDMKSMKHCQGMSHDMMMKNSKCIKMMKMHPDMMDNTGTMSH